MNTTDYTATIEYLPGRRAAIIELTDPRGEWAGGGKIEIRSSLRSDLYEEGYRAASRAAAVKGGRLSRFSEYVEPRAPEPKSPAPTPSTCGQTAAVVQLRRPGNALNIEHFVNFSTRCRLKLPEHWTGSGASSLRWLGSGGDPTVFGACTPERCPAA